MSPLLFGFPGNDAFCARLAGAPHVALSKTRRGDLEVEISLPDLERQRGRTPVLVTTEKGG